MVGLWDDATKTTIGDTAEYTNSVELADINGDGMVDILFANGGDYEAPGKPEFSRVFLNQGAGKMFKEVSKEVFGPDPMLAVRAIRVADVSGDGIRTSSSAAPTKHRAAGTSATARAASGTLRQHSYHRSRRALAM